MVKLRSLIVPASKETRIPKAVFEAVQTLSRNLVCTLELMADAYWASRETHFIMLNARTLRSTQLLTLSSLESLAVLMREGPQAQRQAAAGQLAEIAGELKTLMQEVSLGQHGEAPIYGYVWLSMELAQQLEELGICSRSAPPPGANKGSDREGGALGFGRRGKVGKIRQSLLCRTATNLYLGAMWP